MRFKYFRPILAISIFLLFFSLQYTYAKTNTYVIYRKIGKVYLIRNHKIEKIDKSCKYLKDNDIIITKRDSSIVIKVDNRYLKIFPYSKLVIKQNPFLLYGKIQIDKSYKLNARHYILYPIPREGKTSKIVVWPIHKGPVFLYLTKSKDSKVEKVNFFNCGKGYYKALFGVPLGISSGKYWVNIKIGTEDRFGLIKIPFYINAIYHKKGIVRLETNKKDILLPSDRKNREIRELKGILLKKIKRQYWRGKFIYPVKHPGIVSGFGEKRNYYLGRKFLYERFHYGIDLYGKYGTEVIAPNSGVVALACKRITTGNTVVINHGMGVFSLFFHLSKIYVHKGNFVSKGSEIGLIGSSGLAEGSHLHWGLLVNMVYVDPLQWIRVKY